MNAYTAPVLVSCWMCRRSRPILKLPGILNCYKDRQNPVRVSGPEADGCERFLPPGESA